MILCEGTDEVRSGGPSSRLSRRRMASAPVAKPPRVLILIIWRPRGRERVRTRTRVEKAGVQGNGGIAVPSVAVCASGCGIPTGGRREK